MDDLLALRDAIFGMIETQESYNYYLFNIDGNYSNEDLFRCEERVRALCDIRTIVESRLDERIVECNLVLSAIAQCNIEQQDYQFDVQAG